MTFRKHLPLVLAAIVLTLSVTTVTSLQAEKVKASKDLLVGKWTGKFQITAEKKKDLPPAALAQMDAIFGKARMHIQFKADGTALATMDLPGVPEKEKNKKGDWIIVSKKKNVLTVQITDSKDKDDRDKLVFKFISKNKMHMSPPGAEAQGMYFEFTRNK